MDDLLDYKLDCIRIKHEQSRKNTTRFFKDKKGKIRKIVLRGFYCMVEDVPRISAY